MRVSVRRRCSDCLDALPADRSKVASPKPISGIAVQELPKPIYARPNEDRVGVAVEVLRRSIEQYITPGVPTFASLLIRASISHGVTTAESMWAIYDQILSGRYMANWLSDPRLGGFIANENDPPAGLTLGASCR